jgi:hypothetical protein
VFLSVSHNPLQLWVLSVVVQTVVSTFHIHSLPGAQILETVHVLGDAEWFPGTLIVIASSCNSAKTCVEHREIFGWVLVYAIENASRLQGVIVWVMSSGQFPEDFAKVALDLIWKGQNHLELVKTELGLEKLNFVLV